MSAHGNASAARRGAASPRHGRLDERGIALPMALIFVALLTTLMLSFAVLSQTEAVIGSNHMLATQARTQAESGFERAVWALSQGVLNPGAPGSLAATSGSDGGGGFGSVPAPESASAGTGVGRRRVRPPRSSEANGDAALTSISGAEDTRFRFGGTSIGSVSPPLEGGSVSGPLEIGSVTALARLGGAGGWFAIVGGGGGGGSSCAGTGAAPSA